MITDTFSLPQPNTYTIHRHTTILNINDFICIPMIHASSIWNINRVQATNLLGGQVLCWMKERYTHVQYFPLSNKYQVNYNCKIGPMQLCKIQYLSSIYFDYKFWILTHYYRSLLHIRERAREKGYSLTFNIPSRMSSQLRTLLEPLKFRQLRETITLIASTCDP